MVTTSGTVGAGPREPLEGIEVKCAFEDDSRTWEPGSTVSVAIERERLGARHCYFTVSDRGDAEVEHQQIMDL